MVEATTKVITAFSVLVGASAWPIFFSAVFWTYRKEVRAAISKAPAFIDRMKAVKIWNIEAELERVASLSEADPDTGSGRIGAAEVKAAAKIEVDSTLLGEQNLLAQLDRLCI